MSIEEVSGVPNDAVESLDQKASEISQEKIQDTPESNLDQVETTLEDNKTPDTAQAKRQRQGGFQKKIERLALENAELRAQLLKTSNPQNQNIEPVLKAPDPSKPQVENFQNFDDYIEAIADWKVEKRLQQRDQAKKQETLQESYDRQMKEARNKYSDFEEAIADYDFHLLPNYAREALLHSNIGAELAYYIANNPEIGDNLAKLNPIDAVRQIGRLEAKLESENIGKKAVKVTQAPPPITPIKAQASKQRSLQSYIDAGDHEGYAAARRAGVNS
jgi:hypothetical protein